MLICASFSDSNLHTRGSFRAVEKVSSQDKFAYTHRGGKWATFYDDSARQAQLSFFDRYLKGRDIAKPPPVRLEVQERGTSSPRCAPSKSGPWRARTGATCTWGPAARSARHHPEPTAASPSPRAATLPHSASPSPPTLS